MSEEKKMMEIRNTATKYLTLRSRTIEELRYYLLGKGFADESVATVVDEFVAYDYLNDIRYCQQYFAYAFSKGKGKRMVFAELRNKGVDVETIQLAFANLEGEYDEKRQAFLEAEKVLRAALAGEMQEKPVSEKLIGRVARRLQSKGYDSDVIYRVIGELRR